MPVYLPVLIPSLLILVWAIAHLIARHRLERRR